MSTPNQTSQPGSVPISKWAEIADWLLKHKLFVLVCRGLLLSIYLFCLYLFIRNGVKAFYTPDLPWILATGDHILKHADIPAHDIYSWTHPQKPWVLYQWGFEFLLAYLKFYVGELNLVRIAVAAGLITYVSIPIWILLQRGVRMMVLTPLLGLTLVAAVLNLSLRPMLASVIFSLFVAWLIHDTRRGEIKQSVLIIIIAAIGVIWGNMHTGITMGLLSIILFGLGDWLELKQIYRFTPVTASLEAHPLRPRVYLWCFLAMFLGSLINPYGIGIYSYLWWLSGQSYLNETIIELQSLNFHLPQGIVFSVLGLMFLSLTMMARKTMAAHAWLHLVVFSLMTIFVCRMIVWAALYYALFLPVALQHWINSLGPRHWLQAITEPIEADSFIIGSSVPYAIGLCVFLMSGTPWFKATTGLCEALTPGITTYYEKLKHPGDVVFSDSNTGSCSLRIDPSVKVFGDTRFDFYGQEFTREMRETVMGLNWEKTVNKWHTNTYLLPPESPLSLILTHHPDYKQLYKDKGLAIYRQRLTESPSVPPSASPLPQTETPL